MYIAFIFLVPPFFVPDNPKYQRAFFPPPHVIAAWKANKLVVAVKDPPRGLFGPPPVRGIAEMIFWSVAEYDAIEVQKLDWKPTDKADELKERGRLLRLQRDSIRGAVVTWRGRYDHLPPNPLRWLDYPPP